MRCSSPGRGELQQLAQGGGARPVQGRAHRHLRRFQIEASGLAPILENHPQELIYFARDLLPDRFRRFFSRSAQRLFPFHGAQLANLFVDLHQALTQRLKLVELGHLSLCLAQGSRAGEGLRDRFASDLTGQTKVRSMTRVPGLMAAAVGFPAAARNTGN